MKLALLFSTLILCAASASALAIQPRNYYGKIHSFFDYFEAFSKIASYKFKPIPQDPKGILITCMDVRLMPEQALGLRPGQVHVLRNAGGRVHSLLPSIVVSQKVLGTTEITVLHHSECGMNNPTNAIKEKIDQGINAHDIPLVDQLEFETFSDLEQSLIDDYNMLRDNPLINSDNVRIGVWNITTNQIREVTRPA